MRHLILLNVPRKQKVIKINRIVVRIQGRINLRVMMETDLMTLKQFQVYLPPQEEIALWSMEITEREMCVLQTMTTQMKKTISKV